LNAPRTTPNFLWQIRIDPISLGWRAVFMQE
jgi:hypothetical protein